MALAYGSPTAVTITLTSLADDAYRCSASIDNSTNLYLDCFVGGSTQVGATGGGVLAIYAYGTNDGGTTWTANVPATDSTINWTTQNNINGWVQLARIGYVSVNTGDDNNDLEWGPYSVARGFGGWMPEQWGIVIENKSSAALNATGTNNTVDYTGVLLT